MIYYWDKKLKKPLHVQKVDIIIIENNIDLMSAAQRMHFDRTCSKWLLLRLCQLQIIIILMGCIYIESPCIYKGCTKCPKLHPVFKFVTRLSHLYGSHQREN